MRFYDLNLRLYNIIIYGGSTMVGLMDIIMFKFMNLLNV